MKQCFLFFALFSGLIAHNPNTELPKWNQFVRMGVVQVGTNESGLGSYGRLKRTTEYTFHDIRFYGHFFSNNEEIRVRQKSSTRFLNFDEIYTFNTLVYEKNTFLNVDLRYHYNQGLGYLLQKSPEGNMTIELGVAFDNSDYLNTEKKTSYIRSAMTLDQSKGRLHSKVELDYFHQISEIEGSELSRWQVVAESQFKLFNRYSLIVGLTQDSPTAKNISLKGASIFVTISLKQPLSWTI